MSEKEKDKIQVKNILKTGNPQDVGKAFKEYFSKYYAPVKKVGEPEPYLVFDGKLPL
jgi:hypothetical protein